MLINLSGKTLAELQAMTKDQLIAGILEGQTGTELQVNESEEGRGPIQRIEVVRDRLTGRKLSRRVIHWTYYPSGCVYRIRVIEQDADNHEVSRRTITHYEDGRQPTVEEA